MQNELCGMWLHINDCNVKTNLLVLFINCFIFRFIKAIERLTLDLNVAINSIVIFVDFKLI